MSTINSRCQRYKVETLLIIILKCLIHILLDQISNLLMKTTCKIKVINKVEVKEARVSFVMRVVTTILRIIILLGNLVETFKSNTVVQTKGHIQIL